MDKTRKNTNVMNTAIVFQGLGWMLWIVALFLPAIEYQQIGSGIETDAKGWECFLFTMIPMCWVAIPWLFIPLFLVNLFCFSSVLPFSTKALRYVPSWLLAWAILSIPTTMITLVLATKLHIGFYFWVIAVCVFGLSNFIMRFENRQTT